MARRANRLAQETSPYLLQHAHNPVDWHPWGEEALARAKAEDKPILLSIGYSACHWCHVMERESFENDAIAKQMNESFICIKVDREERPDLDEIYMNATVALSGSGGWPMTVFLTPETKPFFGGTYFPPEDRHGRPGFPALLTRVAQMWKAERQSLLDQAQNLTAHVEQSYALPSAGGISDDALRAASRALARNFDESFGGFGGAPKFPAPTALSLLLRTFRRTGKRDLLHMVTHTLDGMMSGGMYDQLGGGFARYSVDRTWLVPHFEKMLYDNAQLADVYIEGFQATGHVPYRRVARETLDYALREMQSPGGGFFSASDADTEGVEGKYYVFTKTEIEKAVGQPAATHFCAFHGVTDEGNFDGTNVLTARRNLAQVAKEFGIDQAVLLQSLEVGREKLLALRATRTAPDVDDKVITSWNGLMIRALANGARAFSEPRYLEAACRAADFLLQGPEAGGMRRADGGLYRTSRAGRAHLGAYLEDYAFVADGLLALYEAGGGERYLFEARALTERFLSDFASEDDGALYSTPRDSEALISRPRSGNDAAIPSANAIACAVLGRLSFHFDLPEWRAQAIRIASSFAGALKRAPRAYCGLLCSVDFLLEAPLEIVLTGDPTHEHFREMSIVLGARYLPNRVEARLGVPPRESSALAAGRFEEGAPPKVYICQNFTCQKPMANATDLTALLDETEKQRLGSRAHELGSRVLPGRATEEGTASRLAQGLLPTGAYRALDGLFVSRLAVGTHRIGLDQPEHHTALTEALRGGLNLIDTSPSFALGDSERVTGQVLRELSDAGAIDRSHIVIVSKVGVALGAAAEELEVRRAAGTLTFAGPLGAANEKASPETPLGSGAFCLDPTFLKDQITGSLERLGLEHLDVCLIQSPEHMLAAGQPRETLKAALLSAFNTLEGEVANGRIGRYGILSNTLARPRTDPLSLDLQWIGELAQDAAGTDHHFRVVELPLSIGDPEALVPGTGKSVVQIAADLGLSLLACRPLSPVIGGALLRLVDPPASPDGASADLLKSARYKVASLEAEFETTFAAQLRLAGKVEPGAILPLSGPLGQALEQAATRQQFELAEATMVSPRLRQLLSQLDRAFAGPGDQKWAAFRDKYIAAVGAWLAAVRETTTDKNRALLGELGRQLETSPVFSSPLPSDFSDLPWVERALGLLLSEDQLTSALVGLRHTDHVRAALKVLSNA